VLYRYTRIDNHDLGTAAGMTQLPMILVIPPIACGVAGPLPRHRFEMRVMPSEEISNSAIHMACRRKSEGSLNAQNRPEGGS
jgi:hypothetical protein